MEKTNNSLQWNNLGGLPTNAGSAMSPISSNNVNERGFGINRQVNSNVTVTV